MRKIERDMNAAIARRETWQSDNTSVYRPAGCNWVDVRLHGNLIACIFDDGSKLCNEAMFSQYPTRTTVSRLRALGFDASIKCGYPRLNGKPI